nr:ribonuclease R [Deinococcota bacterium]
MSELDREQLYSFFKDNPEKPWHVQDVQKRLEVGDRAWLNRELSALADEGKLIRTRRRTFGLPQEMNLILGRLQVTAGGYGFVISEEEGESDLFIPADNLGGAWDGDKVVARPNPLKKEGDRMSGSIVRVLERKNSHVVGTLEYSKGYAILRPDSPRLKERILLTPESVGDYSAGSRLVAHIVWPETSGEREPFAEVKEYLGEGDDPEIETRAVMIKFDLMPEFEPETLAEARAVPPTVSGEMMAGRTDMRAVNTFTIDGEDAKDFDDALSVERLKGEGRTGVLRVGVHIADVSYYVAEGTSLDKEAQTRATSVYLPGRVLPMLPEELSNGICSLVEGEARLALSVMIDLTREGEVKGYKFKETTIKSDARLSYEQVQAFADGGRLPPGKLKLERDIKALLQITQALRQGRLGGGALDFSFTEAKVDVDETGALHLMPIRSNQARQLIEEMMLLANRLVAQDLSERNIPALYRVHEDPSEAKFQDLQKALARLGYTLDLEHTKPADLQTILKQAAGKPEAQLVNTLLLRSLKQARYSADNLGHFGLAFQNYLHFTSPIRRYPDLVVHRVLRASLQHRLSPTLKERMRSDFPGLAEHSSQRERLAEEAERDLSRYFHARWAKEHRGEEFQGYITGVTNFGVFVGLSNAVEGLIHVSNLDDDYYMYLEDAMMLMGKHTRRRFRLGEPLRVRILDANPTLRQIDLLPSYMPFPALEPEAEEGKKSEARARKPEVTFDPRSARPTTPAEAKREAAGETEVLSSHEPQPPATPAREPLSAGEAKTAPPKR